MNSVADTPCGVGCPIRTFPDQSPFAAPRNFSQRITSFIASQCQGIHQMLLSCLILIRSQICLVRARPLQTRGRGGAQSASRADMLNYREMASFGDTAVNHNFLPTVSSCVSPCFRTRQRLGLTARQNTTLSVRPISPCDEIDRSITNYIHNVQEHPSFERRNSLSSHGNIRFSQRLGAQINQDR